jgi:hypothetical protein
LQTRQKRENSSDQHIKWSGREREKEKEKEKTATQSQEERAQTEEKVKGEVANAKEEEKQQAVVTRRVAGTVAPHINPPSDKAPI